MSDVKTEHWAPSCGGNFFQGTACATCTTCLNNLQRIKDATPLGLEIKQLRSDLDLAIEALEFYARTGTWEAYGTIALEDSGVTAMETLAKLQERK